MLTGLAPCPSVGVSSARVQARLLASSCAKAGPARGAQSGGRCRHIALVLARNDTYDSAFEPFLGDLQALT